MYIAIPGALIALAILCAKLFHWLPPSWLIGVLACLSPSVCAVIRCRLWSKRNTLFSPDELEKLSVKIFFAAIPIEICFSLIGMGFIILGK